MKLTRLQITAENLQLHEVVKRQTRELEIEAALERVRSKAMAMHSSNELNTIIGKVFTECIKLDIQLDRGIIMIFDPASLDSWWWMANPEADLPRSYHVPYNAYEPYLAYLKGWKERTRRWTYVLEGKEKKDWDAHIFTDSEMSLLPVEVKQVMRNFTKVYLNASFNNFGSLTLASLDPMPEEHFNILLRFANVFDLTYTRFNDLKQAEIQAREAQIETSLERVRSRTMAMQKSDELAEVAALLFRQVSELGIKTWTTGFNVWSEDGNSYTDFITSPQGNIIKAYTIDATKFSVFQEVRQAKNRKEKFWVQYLEGELLKQTYRELSRFGNEKQYEKMLEDGVEFPSSQYVHFVFGSQVSLMFITYLPIPEAHEVFKRFGIVFDQTYTRFLDLQKAEAQAKEAIKAASFDRVRAEIASMRTVDDLQQIIPLIRQELLVLGVPFTRCGVFIMNEPGSEMQAYLSSPEGHSLATLNLPFGSSELVPDLVNYWHQRVIFTTHWNKDEFLRWMQTMIKEGQVQSRETYQGGSQPPESLDLHFVPFEQGMLYVGNSSALKPEELQLVESLAGSFSMAYARYRDFRQLEEAKNQMEKTYTELKAAQSQLIQAEKMASLGELTAGIAHEIQNPLNFVNNFSELSNELLDDLKIELENNHPKEAIAIADEIKQNLEKILHHGKRADSIVKGMLQHSRISSGVREPTDINKLCDEYLRLAYHGSRAKDSSFNVPLKTNFDPTCGTINIVPQDIGRVILNLVTNAFYAVTEKSKKSPLAPGGGIYEPTVIVKTSLIPPSGGRGAWVLISVKDNGRGISKNSLDKIFQPFFTTKPTGKGTGLGLSLSYDIVKAHGGDIKVETEEGEGAEFTIALPVK